MSADERLTPKRRLIIGVFTLAMAATGFATGRTLFLPTTAVAQPIQFNHRKHVKDVALECSVCHEHYATGEHSGLPGLATCEGCHSTPITKSAEEQRLLALIGRDDRPAFRKLFRMPDHVHYSHRRHVVAGSLTCETCHGAIADTTAPPVAPLQRITMDTCVTCHIERGVSTDCTKCHR